MSLVVFTGFAGMIAAPGTPDVLLMITGIACISLCAGAAGALNMWYESDIDRVMSRTWHRPLPQGRISSNRALGLGIGLTVAPIVVMGVIVNWLAAALLGLASLIYVVAYTMWLKRTLAAKYRDRRRFRGFTAAHWMGLHDWRDQHSWISAVFDHLLVDAAALLGSRLTLSSRLRTGRDSDDAGHRRGRQDSPVHLVLYPSAVAGGHSAGILWSRRDSLRRVFGDFGRGFHRVLALPLPLSKSKSLSSRLFLFYSLPFSLILYPDRKRILMKNDRRKWITLLILSGCVLGLYGLAIYGIIQKSPF